MDLSALVSPYKYPPMNSVGASSPQGAGSSASPEMASRKTASSTRPPDIMKISSPSEEIKDLLHVRKDLRFPVTTINKSLFTEIMEPKSQEALENHLRWMCLVRDIFQPRPVIVEDTNKELERINLSSEKKDFDSIREQRYWQNQIFLRWAVQEGLSNGYHEDDLKSWLEDLHKIACSGLDGHNHYYECDTSNGKFSSPSQGIMTRYQEKSPEELKGYLEKFKQFLDLRSSSKNNVQDWLADLAEKYVNVTSCPPFKQVNNSTIMNILNLMLKNQGMNEISHSLFDKNIFFSNNETELQKEIPEFSITFLRAILQTNPMLEQELGTDSLFFNIPAKFRSGLQYCYEHYLKELSELDKTGLLTPKTYHLLKYVSPGNFVDKSQVFRKIIAFKDVLGKGFEKGVFTDELFRNCLNDISEVFDNLNLNSNKVLSNSQKVFLLESLGLKSRYPGFETSVSTLDDLLANNQKELTERGIDEFEVYRTLHTEGLNFLNSQDS